MKIEINGPSPKDLEEEPQVDQNKRQFLKGLGLLGLSMALGGTTARLLTKEQEAVAQVLPKKDDLKKTPEKIETNLFQGTPEEILQQAIDFPKEFIEQQGLSIEYQDPASKKDFEALVQIQVQEIYETHHQNIKELDRLFEHVQNAAPIIIKEAEEQGVPIAIALGIAMHESRCNPDAHDSIKGASGLFQIKKATAESLGLKVSAKVDERLDPTKNTRAGLIYLKKLYNQYGRWDLAMLAYNEGMGNLNHYLASIQEKPGQPLLEKVNKLNLQKQEVTYLCLHQSYNEQNKYPLNVEANIRLYLWYVYEKASQQQDVLVKK